MHLSALAAFFIATAAPYEYAAEAFRISLADAPATAQDDGLRGSTTLQGAGYVQSLSWSPAEDVSAERALTIAEHALRVATSAGDKPLPAMTVGLPQSIRVDGQEAVQVLTEGGGATMSLTMWNCPKAGVHAILITGGDTSALAAHRLAVSSVRCGQSPVQLRSVGFTFAGPPSEWTLTDAGNPLVRHYVSANALVQIVLWSRPVRASGVLSGPLCEGALRVSVDDYLTRSSAKAVTYQAESSSTGCRAHTQGAWNDGGELSLLSEARSCESGMSVYAHALSEDPTFDLDTTSSLWACEPPPPLKTPAQPP